ncbi:hypothetical protein F5B18DRAFT_655785 [Nemania serpens]|nr:hypothetical protein F5B18DRAFT_655785 [Nemania serpens]
MSPCHPRLAPSINRIATPGTGASFGTRYDLPATPNSRSTQTETVVGVARAFATPYPSRETLRTGCDLKLRADKQRARISVQPYVEAIMDNENKPTLWHWQNLRDLFLHLQRAYDTTHRAGQFAREIPELIQGPTRYITPKTDTVQDADNPLQLCVRHIEIAYNACQNTQGMIVAFLHGAK